MTNLNYTDTTGCPKKKGDLSLILVRAPMPKGDLDRDK